MSKPTKMYKKNTFAKLSAESFIGSSLSALSAFFIWLFHGGVFSFVTQSAEKVDGFFRKFVVAPFAKKTNFREKFKTPVKNAVASGFRKSRVFEFADKLRVGVLNMSLRSVGIFLLTFGIYSAAIFFLKFFYISSFGKAGVNDISAAAVMLVVGLLLLFFGEKSILFALGNGKITSPLLAGCLGVNESSFVRLGNKKTHIGIMFLLGSVCGIITLFVPPLRVLLTIAVILIFVAIMNMPEFGLLLSVLCISFASLGFLAATVAVSLASYFLKCFRLKRNLRFGTVDILMLVMAAVFVVSSASAGLSSDGNLYLVIFIGVYFLSKNLLCSGRLIFQSFNTICLSVFSGTLLFLLKDISELIPNDTAVTVIKCLTPNTVSPDILALLVTSMLPFSLSVTSKCIGKRRALVTLLLSLACTFATDSVLFLALDIAALAVYIALSLKAPSGAALTSLLLFPPALSLASGRMCGNILPVAEKVSGFGFFGGSGAVEAAKCSNFWFGLLSYCGAIPMLFFGLVLLLVFQRVLSVRNDKMRRHESRRCGTVISAAFMLTFDLFVFNPFADLRMFIIIWFIYGLCGSTYYEFRKPQYFYETEEK